MADGPATLQLKVGGISCSFCAGTIDKALRRLPGVERVNVSLAHEEALVRYDPRQVGPERITRTLRAIGYTVRDPRKVQAFEEQEAELDQAYRRILLAALFTLLSLSLMALVWIVGHPPRYPAPMLLLAFATIFGPGLEILRMALASLRRAILNQHVLLEFAAFGGLAGGLLGFVDRRFPAADFLAVATFVTTYHLLSGYVSLLVRARSSRAVRRLMALQPDTARVVRAGAEVEVPIAEVQAGDLVRIRPGERIPVDGLVVAGCSAVDQAFVTGEPLPRDVAEGDEVIGGSVNTSGALKVRVDRVGEASFLAGVIRSVEEARALKPGLLALVDRVLAIFVPGVLVTAAVAFVGWTGGTWLLTGRADLVRATYATLGVLVMGYPCALGMATPLAMIRGGGRAAERGILMRSGEAFQLMGDVREVIFDKTGTLTAGRPRLAAVRASDETSEAELLGLAAAAEAASEHPLGRAIVEAALEREIEIPDATDFRSLTGIGVEATVANHHVAVLKPEAAVARGVGLTPFAAALAEAQRIGRTVVVIVRDRELLGLLEIADLVRSDAATTVADLRARGIASILVTGDNQGTARTVAEAVGIERVFANVLPTEKAGKVRELQAGGRRVLMVGDGINDAPALMQADVGVAMGAGTDIAIESADVILVGDRLGAVVDAIELGQSSYAKTKANVAIAFGFNGLGIPLAAAGVLHPIWAMFAMLASVTAVLANSFLDRDRLARRARRTMLGRRSGGPRPRAVTDR